MAKKSQELAVVDEKALAELKESYPVETGSSNRIVLPTLVYKAQDVVEGKGKLAKVVIEAGTYLLNVKTDEIKENGKNKWVLEEIGKEIEGIILYHRHKLSLYNESTELYTSSSVYDSQDEVLKLWENGKIVAEGTPAELKKKYMYVDKADGKEKSSLEDVRVLYILYKDELHELQLHGSSMYSFLKYIKTVTPPAVVTRFSSEPKVKGSNEWNMATFKPIRNINVKELQDVLGKVKEIKMAIRMEKGNSSNVERISKEDEDFERLAKKAEADM